MKGHAKIELTNVKTGEVEVIEEDNLITNAAQIYVSLCSTAYSKGVNNNVDLSPLWDSVFGGIKLFGSKLTEDANNYELPNIGTTPIIGYASSNTTPGTDKLRGSRNILETKSIENGVQIVWDFATSEANGQIACVCLTSREAGTNAFVFRNPSLFLYTLSYSSEEWIVDFDAENETITTLVIYNPQSKKKYRFPTNHLRLNEKLMQLNLLEETTLGSSISVRKFKNGGDGNLYRLKAKTDTTITLEKFDLQTDILSDVVLNIQNIRCLGSSYYAYDVQDGYLYVMKSSLDGYYRINMANSSDVKQVDLPKFGDYNSMNHHITTLKNGNILIDGYISDPESGNYYVVCSNYNVSGGSIYGGSLQSSSSRNSIKMGYFAGNGYEIFNEYTDNTDYAPERGSIVVSGNNLMSINNLQSPVIKTADKTMKITYTLLYENEVTV